jgi:hypothetical protein
VQTVDNLTLYIALVIAYFRLRETLAEAGHHLFHGDGAVNLGLTYAREVQIRPVYYFYSSIHIPQLFVIILNPIHCPIYGYQPNSGRQHHIHPFFTIEYSSNNSTSPAPIRSNTLHCRPLRSILRWRSSSLFSSFFMVYFLKQVHHTENSNNPQQVPLPRAYAHS